MGESRAAAILEIKENNTGHDVLLPFNDVYQTKFHTFVEKVKEEANSELIENPELSFNMPPFEIMENSKEFKNHSEILQNWIGHIKELKQDGFIAELIDLTRKGTNEIAEFDYSDISPDDESLIKLGGTFYWTISKKMNRGQISNESLIRFQRLINWEFDDIIRLEEKVSKRLKNINFID